MEQVKAYKVCLRRMICFLIKLYQCLISPFLQPCCRFYPTCSQYAILAIMHHGIGRGMGMTCARLLRCHPWSAGGEDPVLLNKEKR